MHVRLHGDTQCPLTNVTADFSELLKYVHV